MSNQICEFCGREFSNLAVHQRFCKAKKEETKTISATVPEESVPKNDEPTEEQLEETLKETIKGSEVVKVKNKKNTLEDLPDEKQDRPSEKQVNLVAGVLKEKEKNEESLEKELSIEFNEPKDIWEEKLVKILNQVESGKIIRIKLISDLSHEFSDILDIRRYPSDQFMNVIRNYCSEWKSVANELGGQTFIVRIK